MSALNERIEIINLATGKHKDREHIDPNVVYEQSHSLYVDIIDKLEQLYDLTLLDGALESDEFLKTKNEFVKQGDNYGYIHSYVDRLDKSNLFRFQYRRPTPSGKIIYKGINMSKTLGGYSPSAFKRAGHELEKELCIMTEQNFLILRNQSKLLRSVLRKLGTLQYNQSED